LSIEQRIRQLGISLPSGTAPAANYANAVRAGNLLFIAGKGPLPENGVLPKGGLGREYSVEDGYRFARSAALDLIAVMRAELGSLDRVVRVVEVQGFVNATPEFEDHAKVLNGCSDWSCPVSVDGLALGSQAVIHRLRARRLIRNRARRPVGNRALVVH
jgi:enamine deaminase RidA (YjgF/YER057c/UK114 family)